MEERILLISPDEGFGELIRQVLVEEGDYDVDLVKSGYAALSAAQENDFAVALLDCAANDVPFTELTGALRDWHAGLKVVIVPPNNDPDDPAIDHTNPDALLSKPFYLPDLLEVIASLLNNEPVDTVSDTNPFEVTADSLQFVEAPEPVDDYPWLHDVTRAAQYLASLSLETSARAALITRAGELWAYAGQLGQPSANKLADTLGSQGGSDVARFVTLDDSEYMLYATGLTGDMVLALIFDSKTPFSKVRSQSGQVAKALAGEFDGVRPAPGEKTPKPEILTAGNHHPASSTSEVSDVDVDMDPVAVTEEVESKTHAEPALPLDWLPQTLAHDNGLLEEVEQTMEPFAIPSDWKPQRTHTAGPRTYLEELLGEPIPSVSLPYETRMRADVNDVGESGYDQQPSLPAPETMAETRPTRVTLEDAVPQFESESSSYFDITYACMLIPRMPQHHLVSEMARYLEKWMFQICVSFDWRMEQLSIRPDYMQWMVKVHSATAPRFLMQIVTRITSQRIFDQFPQLTVENPSAEFWAPGWLVITSETLPSQQMVQDFIRKTRQRQGLV